MIKIIYNLKRLDYVPAHEQFHRTHVIIETCFSYSCMVQIFDTPHSCHSRSTRGFDLKPVRVERVTEMWTLDLCFQTKVDPGSVGQKQRRRAEAPS